MRFRTEQVRKAIKASPVGKETRDGLYIHASAEGKLPKVLQALMKSAESVTHQATEGNVIKFHKTIPKVSFLSYARFFLDPHPQLLKSVTVVPSKKHVHILDFSGSDNPPILHRKEEMLLASHPFRPKFKALTRREEEAGLLSTKKPIGRLNEWQALLDEKGLKIQGHKVVTQ